MTGKHRKPNTIFHICHACGSALPEDEMVQRGEDWYCADWYACVKRRLG